MAQLNRRVSRQLRSILASLGEVRGGTEELEDRVLMTFDPTAIEQLMLYDTNRVRVDPQGELNNYLFTSLSPLTSPDPNVNFAMSYFSVNTTQFLNEWAALVATTPLAWHTALYDAAAGHNAAMIAADEQSHQVAGEPALGTRLTNAGYSGWTSAAENVYAYANTEFYGHSGFLIDWGNVTPGHRNTIMNSNFNEVGISITPENNGATDVGPLVVTQDFGKRSSNPYLLGVVYNDLNSNSRYDAGEGLSNVTVTMTGTNGTFTTTTLSAGGWQSAVPAGTYKVTASGGSFSGVTETTVTVASGKNKEVDFVSGQVGGYVNFVRQYPAAETIGVVRGATYYFDANNTRVWDGTGGGDALTNFGNSTDVSIAGDFNGDGYDEIGIFRKGLWYLDMNGDRSWSGTGAGNDVIYNFGIAGDAPIVGDWDGDGFDSIGIVRNGQWYLDANENGNWDGSATDILLGFGATNDKPIVGDWNGDRIDDIGVVRSGYWYLDLNGNRLWGGAAGGDTVFSFGNPADLPLIGDWNYDRKDDVGVMRGGQYYLDQNGNRDWNGIAGGDALIGFGATTDVPLIGRWKPPTASTSAARLTLYGPSTNSNDDLTFQSTSTGISGNYTSIALTAGTSSSTSVSVIGTAINVILGVETTATSASVFFSGPTTQSYDNLTFQAISSGTSGNNIIVRLQSATNGTTSVSVSGTTITVGLATNTNGAVTATASEAAAAISSSTQATALVSVAAGGSGTGVVATHASVQLTGGAASGAILTTASQAAAVIAANTSAAGLVTITSGSSGTATVGTAAATYLSGGFGTASIKPLANFRANEYIDLGVGTPTPKAPLSWISENEEVEAVFTGSLGEIL